MCSDEELVLQPELEQTEVLVVGAGPAGLALAIELGTRGVRCLVVEQNERVGLNPRAKTTNVRTREHLRRWGIAEKLRKAAKLPADYPPNVIFATRLNGPQLAKIENAMNFSPERNDLYSESGQWVPQYTLEEVLRAHAVTLPSVRLQFDTTFVSAVQDQDSVLTTLRSSVTGENRAVRSAYVVGADGSRSVVRETIQAKMEGVHAIAQNLNVQFRAPQLASLHPHGPAIMYCLVNMDVPAIMGPMDDEDHWYFVIPRVVSTSGDISELIRRATNLDFEMEILGDSPWAAHSLIADKYSEGRIFLAGDACHLHPPLGGYGMNMGFADGVDLGWKLAAVLQGWGASRLLSTFERERRPVHKLVIDEAVANYGAVGSQLSLPGLEDPGPAGDATRREAGDVIFTSKLREFRTLGVVLGYRYENSPIIVADGTPPPLSHSMIYKPSACPGGLAPHLWLKNGTSLYDHFGSGFTLLITTDDSNQGVERVQKCAQARNLPLKVIQPKDNRLKPRYMANFALIRPDQHVAWRGDELPFDCDGLLDHVTGRLM